MISNRPKIRIALTKIASSPRFVTASRTLEVAGFLALVVATSVAIFGGAPWLRAVDPDTRALISFAAIVVALLAVGTGEFLAVFGREFASAIQVPEAGEM